MDNFKVISNLRTNESGEEEETLSIAWTQENEKSPSSFDNPLTDISHDQLERYSFAKKIASALARRKNDGSVVMGVYGSPGEGKTTLLNFLKNELSKFEHLIGVRFNPSMPLNSRRLIQDFFSELSDAIENSEDISSSQRKKIVRLLNGYSSFLAPLAAGEDKGRRGLFKKSPEEIKRNLDTLFRKLEKRIVFLVDDLDKTNLGEIKTFLRLIKLSASFPNTVFILSFDEPTFVKLLGGQYKKDQLEMGRKVLDKTVHVSLQIPPAPKGRLLEMCHEGISQILNQLKLTSEEDARLKTFKEKFNKAFALKIKTPRQAKLYVNTLTSTLNLQGAGLDKHYFMLTEALRVFYPEVFEAIRNNPDTFLGVEMNKSQKAEVEENINLYVVNNALANLSDGEKDALKKLLAYMFPCLSGALGIETPGYLVQNPWLEEKPVASKQYFPHYFLINTTGTDDFQREVDKLLLRSAAGNINDIASSVKKLVRQAGTDAFITAVENRIDEVSSIASGNLIRALAQTGGSFLNPDTLFSFTTIISHPAVIIRKLLLNILDMHDRFSIASFLMKESEPVSFAFECLRWIKGTNGTLNERIFTSEIEGELVFILTERIKNLAYRYPVYKTMPEEAPLILSVWSFLGSREETTKYLESTFRKEPENVIEFLKCYLPDEFLENRHYELSGSFLLNLSSSVSGVIDSKAVYNQLEKANMAISAGSEDNGFHRRLLSELAGMTGNSPNGAIKPENQLKVFSINDYEKQKQKKVSENKPSGAEETKKGSLTQVSKGLYRPLYDLFK